MLNKFCKDRVVGPLPNGLITWLINRCDPNYKFRPGMILQVWLFLVVGD